MIRGTERTGDVRNERLHDSPDNYSNNKSGKARSFVFTLNNPDEKGFNETTVSRVLKEQGAKKFTFQLERGNSGTPHFQGVVSFHNPRHVSKIVYIFTHQGKPCAHWEVCRNLKASIKYCSKKDTRLSHPITGGTSERPPQGNTSSVVAKWKDLSSKLDKKERLKIWRSANALLEEQGLSGEHMTRTEGKPETWFEFWLQEAYQRNRIFGFLYKQQEELEETDFE